MDVRGRTFKISTGKLKLERAQNSRKGTSELERGKNSRKGTSELERTETAGNERSRSNVLKQQERNVRGRTLKVSKGGTSELERPETAKKNDRGKTFRRSIDKTLELELSRAAGKEGPKLKIEYLTGEFAIHLWFQSDDGARHIETDLLSVWSVGYHIHVVGYGVNRD